MWLSWLCISLAICLYAWFGVRSKVAIICTVLFMVALLLPITGTPRFTKPPAGKFNILGLKIIEDETMYVLLDMPSGEPIYYRLPYNKGQAEKAQESADEGEQMEITFGEDGGDYDVGTRQGPPDKPKQTEPNPSVPYSQ